MLGIGVNVNVSAPDLPQGIDPPATSLLLETGSEVDRVELLVELLDRLERAYDELGRGYGYLIGRPSLPAKSRATAANDVNGPPAGNVNLPGRSRRTVTVLVPSKTAVTSAGSLIEKRSGDRDTRFNCRPGRVGRERHACS